MKNYVPTFEKFLGFGKDPADEKYAEQLYNEIKEYPVTIKNLNYVRGRFSFKFEDFNIQIETSPKSIIVDGGDLDISTKMYNKIRNYIESIWEKSLLDNNSKKLSKFQQRWQNAKG